MGILYLISTPIGNLEDISIRAIKTLFNVQSIACEDTRRTGLLLNLLTEKFKQLPGFDFSKKPYLISYYEQNEQQRIPELLTALNNGLDIALVADAGTPTISDPGFKLVRECIAAGIKVVSVPGASAVISALSISGLPTDKFLFLGYPPKKPGHRKTFFENITKIKNHFKTTIIIYESPHKLKTTIKEIHNIFGDIDIVLIRELTKIHEERRGEKVSKIMEYYVNVTPKGEYVLLFNL